MPHRGQRIVRQQAKRFNWLAAGRRWRKTTLAMAICVEEALQGKQILWGAPTLKQVRVSWEETQHAIGGYGKLTQAPAMEARFPTGGRIRFVSLDVYDNARGFTADGVVIDECADVAEAAWYDVLLPTLLDTHGWAWGIGTPKRRNWFWREHMAAADRPDSRSWQVPTLGVAFGPDGLIRAPHPLENPEIAFAEIQRLYHGMPERTFRQEILAEFIDDTGGVFRGVHACAKARMITDPAERDQLARDGTYVMGVDWAKSQDYTVLTVMDAATQTVVALDRFNQIDWAVQRARLVALAQAWRCDVILAEKNSIGDPNIEALQREGWPVRAFTTTNQTKAQIIEQLALWIETRQISYPPIPALIDELQAYEQRRLPSGATQYSAPDGMHDDCVMSLALACHAAAPGSGARIRFFD